MKKLMIAAAIVSIGVSAFAASVTWSGNVPGLPGLTTSASYNEYLVCATGYATASDAVAALMDGSASANGDIWYSKNGGYSGSSGKVSILAVSNKTMSGDGSGDWGGETVPFYSIVLDGTAKIGDTDGTATHYFSMTGADPVSKTASHAGLFTVSLGDASAVGAWTPMADTPEPTSGLLLLLGVAGLALRRRHA